MMPLLSFALVVVVVVVQDLLDTPNLGSPAQWDAYLYLRDKPQEYRKRVREQAKKYPPPE